MKSVIITLCMLFVSVSAEAGVQNNIPDLRCDQYVISPSATQFEVLRKCGSPSNVAAWVEERVKLDFYRDIPVRSEEQLYEEPLISKEFVNVQEWEYNFGPGRFIHYLGFENGRLARISAGTYGY